MNNSLSSTTGGKIDSWKQLWNMPGGTFAKITAVGAALGLGYGFYVALPMLIAGAANTLIFITECVAIVVLLMILTSKTFWRNVSLIWLQVNRKLLGLIVKIDPISILENSICELKNKLDIVNDNVTKLGGVLEGMKKNLKKYQDEFKDNVSRRNTSQKILSDPNISAEKALELKSNYIVINNDIARLEKIIRTQQHRIDVSEKYLAVMKKLQVLAKFKVKDATSELRFRKEEYESAKAQSSALRSITAIVNGGLTQSLESELAIEAINTTVNNSIAEMKDLLDGSSDLLTNFDLDSAANIDRVDEIIARFEKNGFSSFDNNIEASVVETVPYQEANASYIGSNYSSPQKESAEPVKIPVKNRYF